MATNVYNLPITGRVVGNQLKYGNTRASGIWMTILWRITAIDVANRQVTMDFTPQIMYDASVSSNYPTDLSGGVNAYDWKMTVEQTAPVAKTVNSSFVTWAKTTSPVTDYSSVLGDSNYPGKSFIGFGNSSMSSYELSNLNGPFRTNEYTYSNTFTYATNGTFSLKISASGNTLESNSDRNLTYYQLWETSATTTSTIDLTLPTIITMNNGYLGDVLDINLVNETVNNELNLLKHTITYSFGELTGTIISNTSLAQVQWVVPVEEFLSQFDEFPFKQVKITCKTVKADGTQVGDYSIDRYLFQDVFSGNPIYYVINDIDPIVLAATQDSTQLVRFMSKPRVEMYVVATKELTRVTLDNNGISTAVLNSSSITNEKYPGGLPNVYKTELQLSDIEDGTFTGIVYNKDGTTTVSTTTRELIPYYRLSQNVFDLKFKTNGEITFTVNGNCYNDSFGENGNFNLLKIQYKYADKEEELEAEEWKTASAATRTEWHNYELNQVISGLDIQTRYFLQVKTSDLLMEETSGVLIVIGKPVFDWNDRDFHVGVPLSIDDGLYMKEDKPIYGVDENGNLTPAIIPYDSYGNTTIGYGNYTEENGETYIYGNGVNIITNNPLTLNGREYGANKVLWSGASHMNGNQSITLSEAISKQPTGIVLVFSLYRNGAAENVSINSAFISKYEVAAMPDAPHTFWMAINAGFSTIGAKYLYIDDTKITGHEGNTSSGNNSGITFNNSMYVLRYVIGV